MLTRAYVEALLVDDDPVALLAWYLVAVGNI